MCSEAIPLQPNYYLQTNFSTGPEWIRRTGIYNNFNATMATNLEVKQQRSHGYLQSSAASVNPGRHTESCAQRIHPQRNPQFDNYLAGIIPNRDSQLIRRPRQRDRSSPPDSFNSDHSGFSSDRSGELRLSPPGLSEPNMNSFRPCCRQKGVAGAPSNSNSNPAKRYQPQEKNTKLNHRNSQRRTRACNETDFELESNRSRHQPVESPVIKPRRQLRPKNDSKPISSAQTNETPMRQCRRTNQKPSAYPDPPTPIYVNCKSMQVNENGMMTRKSRPRRARRSEIVPAKENTQAIKQKKSFSELYSVQSVIGVGGGGVVYAGTRIEDKEQVAIKLVPREKIKRWEKVKQRTVPQEIALMMRVNNHSGVIKLLDWCENAETYVFVLERPKNSTDLFDYIRERGKLKEKEACKIFTQILSAVDYIHSKGVVHRDIKDENIVLDRVTGETKVIDFGCGTLLHDHYYKDFAGTPEFYPPEWFIKHCYRAEPATTWSLGVLLYGMICGEIPFKTKQSISQGKVPFNQGSMSANAKKLISWLLHKDPECRPCIEEIFSHPWIKSFKNS